MQQSPIADVPQVKHAVGITQKTKGSGYFAVNGNLPSETILP